MPKAKVITTSNQTTHGTSANDIIYGTVGPQTIYGEDGNDSIGVRNTSSHGDRLFGGNGNDKLYTYGTGGWLEGGAGHDVLYGGADDTTFVFGPPSEDSSDKVSKEGGSVHFAFNPADYGLTEGNGLIGGQLDPDYFESGRKITSNHATFFFNEKNGMLSWDPDGNGDTGAIPIAKILNGGTVSFDEIVMIDPGTLSI